MPEITVAVTAIVFLFVGVGLGRMSAGARALPKFRNPFKHEEPEQEHHLYEGYRT